MKDAPEQLAKEFGLTANELQEFLPSGQQPTLLNRIGWARTYLRKVGCFGLGDVDISDHGASPKYFKRRRCGDKHKIPEQFREFQEFRSGRGEVRRQDRL